MRKFAALLSLLALPLWAGAQTVTMVFTVGILANATGSTPLADGSLVQLIASPDDIFTAPTPGAFSGGNDIIFQTVAFDSSTIGTAGGAQISVTGLSLTLYPIATYKLALRWFPTLTTAATTPGNSTPYGQFDFNNDPTWVAPSSGNSENYSLLTTAAGGSLGNSTGYATRATAAIPEPSTYAALAGLAALAAALWRKRTP
jgi:hypothetical protein